jgi:peptidoglycan/LPS O-acetylase OafA/YrhL
VPVEANLDILRSIAVLCVIGEHYWLALTNGNLWMGPISTSVVGRFGVLLFFVHTALVLMLSMQRMKAPDAVSLGAQFYIRRIFRIYPLSTLVCIAVSILRIPRNVLGDPFLWSYRIFAENVLLIQNVTRVPPLSDPLWTLPYEVQMYLALPFIFMATRRFWVVSLCALFAAGVTLGSFYYLFEFVPCFLAGVLASLLLPRFRRIFTAALWPVLIICLGVIYCSYHASANSLEKEWSVCLTVGACVPLFRDCSVAAIVTTAKLVARYSYGLYVWHYPVMWLLYRHFSFSYAVERHVCFVLLLSGITIASYHLIEEPLIRVGIEISRRYRHAANQGWGSKSNYCMHA